MENNNTETLFKNKKYLFLEQERAELIKQQQMETELTKKQLENVWFLTYTLLSNAGFEIYIDENGDGSMTVGHKNYEMVYDINGDKKLITK